MKRIPHRTKARLRNSFRTAYTASVCLILFVLAPWAGPFTYISPILSAVAAVNVYYGMWMAAQYKVAYSNVVCSALGVLCGLASDQPALLVVLMFLGLVWVSHCTYYDQLSKVIGSLSLVLGSIFPYITNNAYSPGVTLMVLIAIMQVPFLLTGLTLLVPRRALAVADCRLKASLVCEKLQAAIALTVTGFSLPEDVDFFGSKVEHLLQQSLVVLSELDALLVFVEWEVICFPQHRDMLHSLKGFVSLARACCSQLTGLQAMLAKVVNNATQQAFARALQASLLSSCTELETALELVGAFLTRTFACAVPSSLAAAPALSLSAVLTVLTGFLFPLAARPDEHVDSASQALEAELVALDISLADAGLSLGAAQVPIPTSFASPAACRSFFRKLFEASNESLVGHRLGVFDAYSGARSRYVWEEIKRHKIRSSLQPTIPGPSPDLDPKPEENKQTEEETFPLVVESAIVMEIQRLSLRNFGPRAAFVHRYSQLLVHVGSACAALVEEAPLESAWTPQAYLQRLYKYSDDYVSSTLSDVSWVCGLLHKCWQQRGKGGGSVGRGAILDEQQWSSSPLESGTELPDDAGEVRSSVEQLAQALWPYAQPCKIALSICLTSLFVIVPSNNNNDHTGLWACVVVALIRQESVASSFLVGYQRLEGTVIGAIFSFIIFQGLGARSYLVTIPALVLWLALCAFFRDGARHGYAAVVAGFTPMVLLLGNTPASLFTAYSRIEKTFFGIVIYLVVDNFVLPVKVESSVKAQVLQSIAASREMFQFAFDCVGLLMHEVNRQRTRTNSLLSHQVNVPVITSRGGSSGSGAGFHPGSGPGPGPGSGAGAEVAAEAAALQASLRHTVSAKDKLTEALRAANALLALSVHEPEIWSRAFPQAQYAQLIKQLGELSLQGDSLILAIQGLSTALASLRIKEDLQGLSEHLATFSFMASKLVALAPTVDEALARVHESLNLLYETGAQGAGFGAVCSLSRLIDSLLIKLDEHFRSFYMQDLKNADLDCAFILAWQNVFETCVDTIKALSKVGEAILAVRDVEH